jgi:GAF domain-containing protein
MENAPQDLSPSERELIKRVEAASDELTVALALAVGRDRLGMEVAYVTTIDSKEQTVHALMGDPSAVGLSTGTTYPVQETYCRRMLDGALPSVVPDTTAEPAIRDLSATENIGAYIGVPVTFSDGAVHGTLCSISKSPQSHIGESEARFMRALAAIIAKRLERGSRPGVSSAPPA